MLDLNSMIEEALEKRAKGKERKIFIEVGNFNIIKASIVSDGFILSLVREDKNLSPLIKGASDEEELNSLLRESFGVELVDSLLDKLDLVNNGFDSLYATTKVVDKKALDLSFEEDFKEAWERVA